MEIEEPDDLLRRLKLGREEYVQRLLTMLILGAPYPKWNCTSNPSSDGRAFLERVEALSFGESGSWKEPVFIDECDLPKRSEEEKGSAPDWVVRDDQRLWIIELKTEAGSHRVDQLPAYFELGRHHYPAHRIDLTYLTGPLQRTPPDVPAGSRFAHLTWRQVVPIVQDIWGSSHKPWVDRIREVLEHLDTPWSEWRAQRLGLEASAGEQPDPLAEAIATAQQTAADHHQRGVHARPDSLEDLQQLRAELRDALAADPATESVKPWIWQASSSGGQALTALGAEVGYELRVSWYR